MFHEPSSTCTNFNASESSQTCIPIAQIMATPLEFNDKVLVDVAPKGLGHTTLHMHLPSKLQTPMVLTLESQMAPTPLKEVKTPSTPKSHG
jgi:hypothetical protein